MFDHSSSLATFFVFFVLFFVGFMFVVFFILFGLILYSPAGIFQLEGENRSGSVDCPEFVDVEFNLLSCALDVNDLLLTIDFLAGDYHLGFHLNDRFFGDSPGELDHAFAAAFNEETGLHC